MALINDDYVLICPKCGYMGSLWYKENCSCGLSIKELIRTDIEACEWDNLSDEDNEEYRKKYCYNSPFFSQEENEKRIQRRLKSEEWERNWQKQEELKASWIPRCPICQSTELSKLSAFASMAMVNIGKTWECNNCGSKF